MTRTLSQLVLRDCSACGGQREFETLVCADGHGNDCSELACIDCGAAIVVGIFDFEVVAEAVARFPVAEAA